MNQPSVEIDAACDACGYNLRGLSGAWVRCPECGQQRSRESLEDLRMQIEADAAALQRQRNSARITQAETGANLCALAVGGLVLGGTLQLVAPSFFFDGLLRPLLISAALLGLLGLGVFRWNCGRYRGCWRALLRHQMFAIPTVLLNIAVLLASYGVVFAALAATEGSPACILLFILAAPFALWKWKPFGGLSRRARAEIRMLLQAPAE